MQLPPRIEVIYRALYERHRDLANGDETDRRQLTRKIVEQVRLEFGPQWGTKRADATRPISKDTIALQTRHPLQLFGFDWQNGATREPNPAGEMLDITGQVFVEVAPVDHLGQSTPTPPAPPAPPVELVDHIAQIEKVVIKLGELAVVHDRQIQLLEERSAPRSIKTNRVWGHSHEIQI